MTTAASAAISSTARRNTQPPTMLSSADKGSSRRTTPHRAYMARASAILDFCPPLTVIPEREGGGEEGEREGGEDGRGIAAAAVS